MWIVLLMAYATAAVNLEIEKGGNLVNFLQLKYFRELTKDLNMTATAKRLYISQQTLSHNILRMEEEYGVKLFCRGKKLKLTLEGEILYEFADSVLNRHKILQDTFNDLNNGDRGLLRFGASSLRAALILPEILPIFSEAFPNVDIQVVTDNSNMLMQKIIAENLDTALCILDEVETQVTAELMYIDKNYFCVSERLLDKYYDAKQKTQLKEAGKKGVNVKDFERLPFFLMEPGANRIGSVIHKCFEEAKFRPNVYLTSKSDAFAPLLCTSGVAASFMTQSRILYECKNLATDINVFPLLYKNKVVESSLYIVEKENSYKPRYIEFFKGLLREFCISISKDDLTNVIGE